MTESPSPLTMLFSRHTKRRTFIAGLDKEPNAGLADPKIMGRISDLGGMAIPGSPTDFGKLMADETEKWAKVIKFANIKPD